MSNNDEDLNMSNNNEDMNISNIFGNDTSLFSDVLLCVSDDGKKFRCKTFSCFKDAADHFKNSYEVDYFKIKNNYAADYFESIYADQYPKKITIIRSCKFMPQFLREITVSRKLRNAFYPKCETKMTKDLSTKY